MAAYAAAPAASGGLGYTPAQIHQSYLGPLETPIGLLVLVATLGCDSGKPWVRTNKQDGGKGW